MATTFQIGNWNFFDRENFTVKYPNLHLNLLVIFVAFFSYTIHFFYKDTLYKMPLRTISEQ